MPKKNALTGKILTAMLLGLLVGSAINGFAAKTAWLQTYIVGGFFYIVGAAFINALKMLVVPLVTFSLICGVCGMKDVNALGRIGLKTLGLYLLTTAMAVSSALLVAVAAGPGRGFDNAAISTAGFTPKPAPPFTEVIINLVPSNLIKAFADGEMLQIIIFVIVFGIAMLMIGDKARPIMQLAESLNETMMQVVTLVMGCAPIGIFCLMAKTFAEQGIGLIVPMLGYFSVVVGVLLLHGLGVLTALAAFFGKINPRLFLHKIRPVQLFAFSTASSNATIPVTLQVAEQRLGIKNSTAAFTIPLGATVNMDGTAIMQGVATVFIANVYHVDLTLAQYITVVGMAVLASIGTAGVPGVGLIMLAMVLNQVGLPLEGIGLILGVDRLLDMLRTVVNVTGDIVVTCIVARGEGEIDLAVLEDRDAGVVNHIDLPHRHPPPS